MALNIFWDKVELEEYSIYSMYSSPESGTAGRAGIARIVVIGLDRLWEFYSRIE